MDDAHAKNSWRLGLVGAGGYGSSHLAALDLHANRSGARLVAVADPFAECNLHLQARRRKSGLRLFASMEQMLDEAELDAVFIAAPIPGHFPMAKLAVRRGLPVYLEKPPVPLTQQLEELIALDASGRVCVGFQLIHSDPIRQLKQVIARGDLGDLVSIRGGASAPRRRSYYTRAAWAGRMALDGAPVFDGPMTNALAHILQNIMFLAGSREGACASPREIRAELYRGADIESYDSACVSGILDSGVLFSFAGTHASRQAIPHTLEIQGSTGWARLEGERITFSRPIELPAEMDRDSPLVRSHMSFLRHALEEQDVPLVRLVDTRGFTLATNGALLSSGGIHTIDAAHHATYEVDGDPGTDVHGILPLVRECMATGALFSEAGAPWAVPGETLDVSALRELPMENLAGAEPSLAGSQ